MGGTGNTPVPPRFCVCGWQRNRLMPLSGACSKRALFKVHYSTTNDLKVLVVCCFGATLNMEALIARL